MKTLLYFPLALLLSFSMIGCSSDDEENDEPTVQQTEEEEEEEKEIEGAPKVSTALEVTEITRTTAKCGGNVDSDEGYEIISKGLCWSTEPDPTIEDEKTDEGPGASAFEIELTELEGNTTYYIRAYATNEKATSYGNSLVFTTREFDLGDKGPAGGLIVYVGDEESAEKNQWRYLELASKESEVNILLGNAWAVCADTFSTDRGFGTGLANSEKIAGECSSSIAADALKMSMGVAQDWFLPSIEELKVVYDNTPKEYFGEAEELRLASSTAQFGAARYYHITYPSGEEDWHWVDRPVEYLLVRRF